MRASREGASGRPSWRSSAGQGPRGRVKAEAMNLLGSPETPDTNVAAVTTMRRRISPRSVVASTTTAQPCPAPRRAAGCLVSDRGERDQGAGVRRGVAIAEGDSAAGWMTAARMSAVAVPVLGGGLSRPVAASAAAIAHARAVGRPGRRRASRRSSAEGGGWVGVVGIGCGEGQPLWIAAKASVASRHQSSIAAVIQRVSS